MWSNAIYTFYMVVRGGWVAIKSTLRTRDSSCIPMFAFVADSCTSLPPCYPTPKRFLLVSNFPNWWITISFSERHSPSVPPLLLNCTMWGRVYWLTSVRHDVIINLCTPLMNTVPTTSVMMNIDHLCIICGDVNTDHCVLWRWILTMCVFPAILVIPIELPQIVNKGLQTLFFIEINKE